MVVAEVPGEGKLPFHGLGLPHVPVEVDHVVLGARGHLFRGQHPKELIETFSFGCRAKHHGARVRTLALQVQLNSMGVFSSPLMAEHG